MNSFSSESIYNVAQLYLHYGHTKKALPIYEGLLKKSPQDQEFNSAIATLNLQKGDFSNALNFYNSLSGETLTLPEFGLNYAVAFKLAGKTEEANAALAKVATPTTNELKEYAQLVSNFIRN
jgi:predicted Zn-dependent protease